MEARNGYLRNRSPVNRAVVRFTGDVVFGRETMSSLDDLTYALASAGYSPEQIEEAQRGIIHAAAAQVSGIESVARTALSLFYAMQSFRLSMEGLTHHVGLSVDELKKMSHCIIELGEQLPLQPVEQVKPTERVPYYQKNRQSWWK